jgi:hypothetical protein
LIDKTQQEGIFKGSLILLFFSRLLTLDQHASDAKTKKLYSTRWSHESMDAQEPTGIAHCGAHPAFQRPPGVGHPPGAQQQEGVFKLDGKNTIDH